MAYKSFNQRFPKFKWVLFLAVLITLPLTVFSVQKVSTSTEQHAAACVSAGQVCGDAMAADCCAGLSCSAFNRGTCVTNAYCSTENNRDCIYGCTPTSSGGNCKSAPKLAAPTGLKSYSSYCKISGVEYDTINFNWNAVNNATAYTLYHRIYTTKYSTGDLSSYTSVTRSGNSNTLYLYSTKSLNGRRLQWLVVASNSSLGIKSQSGALQTPASHISCPQ